MPNSLRSWRYSWHAAQFFGLGQNKVLVAKPWEFKVLLPMLATSPLFFSRFAAEILFCVTTIPPATCLITLIFRPGLLLRFESPASWTLHLYKTCYFVIELYQQKAILPVTSSAYQVYLAVTVVNLSTCFDLTTFMTWTPVYSKLLTK